MQALLKVVYVKVALTVEYYQVVAVAFVVAEEKVLAMLGAVGTPLCACNLYRWCFVVRVPAMLDAFFGQVVEYFLYPGVLHRFLFLWFL